MDYVTENSFDQVGPKSTPMWLSTIDLRTNGLPVPLSRNSRGWNESLLSAPGANLYWDQPTILAAFELSKRTGCKCYSDAAFAYTRSFLTACSNFTQIPCIDSRVYYDVKLEQPVDNTATIAACIPYTPAWETVWAVDKKLAKQQIKLFTHAPTNRIHSGESAQNFQIVENSTPNLTIEAEAARIASMCWLSQQDMSQQESLIQQALALARLRFARRDARTSLVPTGRRLPHGVDETSSIAIGAWANVLFWAAEITNEMEFQTIAEQTLRTWLHAGFDAQGQIYHHKIDCKSGQPIKAQTPHTESSPSSQLLNTSNLIEYPPYQYTLRMAEACLSLHQTTDDQFSRQVADRWVQIIKQQSAKEDLQESCADKYGRTIHFLVRASEVLDNPEHRKSAQHLAKEAMKTLYVPKMGMFRSRPGKNRCDSADSPGLLLLALMYLEGNDPTCKSSLQF